MMEEKLDKKPTKKPEKAIKVTGLACHAPFGVLRNRKGEKKRYKRGDVVRNPDPVQIASADPASWHEIKE